MRMKSKAIVSTLESPREELQKLRCNLNHLWYSVTAKKPGRKAEKLGNYKK